MTIHVPSFRTIWFFAGSGDFCGGTAAPFEGGYRLGSLIWGVGAPPLISGGGSRGSKFGKRGCACCEKGDCIGTEEG